MLQTLLPKMREKARHDKSFTDEVIKRLFCNMDELHALHQRLLQDIGRTIGENPTHHSTVARIYAAHVSGVVCCDAVRRDSPGHPPLN